jgi:hypothetical protein
MRSLILDDLAWEKILPGFAAVVALAALMLALTVRTSQHPTDASSGRLLTHAAL